MICRLFSKMTCGTVVGCWEWLTIRGSSSELGRSLGFSARPPSFGSRAPRAVPDCADGEAGVGTTLASLRPKVFVRFFEALRNVTLRTPIYLAQIRKHFISPQILVQMGSVDGAACILAGNRAAPGAYVRRSRRIRSRGYSRTCRRRGGRIETPSYGRPPDGCRASARRPRGELAVGTTGWLGAKRTIHAPGARRLAWRQDPRIGHAPGPYVTTRSRRTTHSHSRTRRSQIPTRMS